VSSPFRGYPRPAGASPPLARNYDPLTRSPHPITQSPPTLLYIRDRFPSRQITLPIPLTNIKIATLDIYSLICRKNVNPAYIFPLQRPERNLIEQAAVTF